MKKIYLLAQQLNAGGVEKVICLLANAFVKKGFSVTIISLLSSSVIVELDSDVELKILTKFKSDRDRKKSLIYKFFRKYLTYFFLKKEIRRISNCIIISSRNEYTKMLSKWGNDSQFKIGHLHHDHKFNKKLLNDFKFKYNKIDYFVHLTDIVCEEIEKIMHFNNNYTKNIFIPNFVSSYECDDSLFRENYIIAVGRFEYEKGFDRLLQIWDKVVSKKKNWKLVLIGDGTMKDDYLNFIAEKKLRDYVELPGFLSSIEVMKYMNRSKIYALSSYEESFSLTCVEAMQNKLPVVSFDIRVGPRVLIKDGKNGFLVEDGNLDLFAEKLLELMENDTLRMIFGEKAYIYAKEYEEESVMYKWLDILNVT